MADNSKKGLVTALEMGPVIAFFIGYLLLRDRTFTVMGQEYTGFILMTALFVPILIASMALIWKITGTLSKMQIMTLVLVVVFGGLTVWLNDERFFKMKPTLIYVIFGTILLVGILRGQSYLKMVMDGMVPLDDAGWMILTRRFCAFFFALAVTNEVIWRNMSTDAWVNFKTFGLTGAMFAFFILQAKLFREHGTDTAD